MRLRYGSRETATPHKASLRRSFSKNVTSFCGKPQNSKQKPKPFVRKPSPFGHALQRLVSSLLVPSGARPAAAGGPAWFPKLLIPELRRAFGANSRRHH